MGHSALRNNTSGDANVAVGMSALYTSATGLYNTGIGIGALYNSSNGSRNVAVGGYAGNALTTGGNNLILGHQVGYTTLTTGSSNILIGTSSLVDTPAASTSNYLNIGRAIKLNLTNVTATSSILNMGRDGLDNTSIGLGLGAWRGRREATGKMLLLELMPYRQQQAH